MPHQKPESNRDTFLAKYSPRLYVVFKAKCGKIVYYVTIRRTGLQLEIIRNHISHMYNYLMISCICIELIEHRLMKT